MRRLTTIVASLAILLVLPFTATAQETLVPGRNFFPGIDGTAARPTKTYSRELTLGSFRKTTGEEGFASGGVERWSYDATRIRTTIPILPSADNSVDLASASFRFRTGYFATVRADGGVSSAPGFALSATTGIYSASGMISFTHNTNRIVAMTSDPGAATMRLISTGCYGWSSVSNDPHVLQDVQLCREAAGVIAQRDGANLQTFRLGAGVTASFAFKAQSDGVGTLLNHAGTDFTRLQFGGVTSSFPAIRRAAANLEFVLADGSAYTDLKAKAAHFNSGSFSSPAIREIGGNLSGIYWASELMCFSGYGGVRHSCVANDGFTVGNGKYLGLGTSDPVAAAEVKLWPDAANIFAQRNGANAQTYRLYNIDSGADDEFAAFKWSGNVAFLTTEQTGTGTLRPLVIGYVGAAAGLPACAAAAQGARGFVTDANATTPYSVVAGGGANKLPVSCDGTNWIIGG